MAQRTRPTLLLIGLVAAGVMSGCDDNGATTNGSNRTLDVLRTRYDNHDACAQDWSVPQDCVFIPDDPTLQGPLAASAASSASSTASSTASGHIGGGGGGGHWYGPYYTRSGTIYHVGLPPTQGKVLPFGTVDTEAVTVRESSLNPGSDIYSRSPASVSYSERAAITRGGFTSSIGEGEGGHGGGEGGHGGGGHGSGGG